MSETAKRVVITGLGVISPIGCNLEEFWSSLSTGKSGITAFESLPVGSLPVRNGGEVKRFTGAIEDFGPLDKNLQRNIRKNLKVMCREIEMGVAASQLALHDSGLTPEARDPDRIGIVFGSEYIITRPEEYEDGMRSCRDDQLSRHVERWPTEGLPRVNPLWLLKYLPNMPASHVAIYNELRGPSNSLTVREASSNLAISEATATIRRGLADAMLVGATGSRIHPVRILHLAKQERLATDRDPPSTMSRPFDSSRDGVVLGEGSAAMMLESLEFAQKRGARILGEIIATSASAVGPAKSRDHIRIAIGNVVKGLINRAGRSLPASWHLHAAGRGDIEHDRSEALGIRDALGVIADKVPVVASKSYFGNLGAGGSTVELAASCLALERGQLFGTLNYTHPDRACNLRIAEAGESPGGGFIHLSYAPQGQASGVLVRKFS